MRYRALVGVDAPESEAEAERILQARRDGTPLPAEERRMVRYEAGDIADFIPEASAVWLLQQGLIEEFDGRSPNKSTGQFVWAPESEVYHDRRMLTERCNTDDIEDARYGNAPPEGRLLCTYCHTNRFGPGVERSE